MPASTLARRLSSGSPLTGLIIAAALTGWACSGKTLVLRAERPQDCPPEYRFTATLSGNVLGVTLTKDNPGDAEDELSALLSYKAIESAPSTFALTDDPTGAGDVSDAAPPLIARVDGNSICLEALGPGDGAADVCVMAWLSLERCYELHEE
jgi:hypothetical protein